MMMRNITSTPLLPLTLVAAALAAGPAYAGRRGTEGAVWRKQRG
jgi:hypothetical protein